MYRLLAMAAVLILAQACTAQDTDLPMVRSPAELDALPADTPAIRIYTEDSAEEYSFGRFVKLTSIATDGRSLIHLSGLKTVTQLEIYGLRAPNVELWNLRDWTSLESIKFEGGTETFELGLQFLVKNTGLKRFSARTSGLTLTPEAAKYLAEFKQLEYLSVSLSETTVLATARALAALVSNDHLTRVEVQFSGAVEPEMIAELAKLPGLAVLNARWTKQIRDITEPLRSHAGLREIAFYNRRLTSGTVQNLATCPNLEKLYLTYCKGIGDAGLLPFKDHACLQLLDLSYVSDVTSEALMQLSCPKLRNLNLVGCSGVTKESLANIARMPALSELSVGGALDDTGMAIIANMRNLASLRLVDVQGLTVEGWSELLTMDWLENLILEGCTVPADLFPQLTGLGQLRTLSLRDSVNMSDELFLILVELPELRYIACDTDQLSEEAQIEVHKRHPAVSQIVIPPRNRPYQANWWKTQQKLLELFPDQVRRERADDSEYWWQD